MFCSGSPGRRRKCEESGHNFRLWGLMLREKFGRGEQSFQFKSTDILLRMHSTQMGWEAICPNFMTEFGRIFSWHCPFCALKLPSSNYSVHSQECTLPFAQPLSVYRNLYLHYIYIQRSAFFVDPQDRISTIYFKCGRSTLNYTPRLFQTYLHILAKLLKVTSHFIDK